MDDGLGPIEIEFLINNPQLTADAAKAETTLQDVAASVQAQAAAASEAISKLMAKGGFSDSQAEVDAYAASLKGVGDAGNVAISGTDDLIRVLNADLAEGKITAEQFRAEVDLINKTNAEWTATTAATTGEQEKQLGVIEELTISLENLKTLKIGADAGQLPILNKQIQETEAELIRFNNIGKVGYDEFGQKIKAVNVELEEELGLLGKLKAELAALEAERPAITDPAKLSQANLQMQNLRQEINRASNMGKVGFDELGNALPTEKTSKFSAALSRATDLGNIAARSVTMFTRQLVGMGVGFLSFEIGAKAIERLVKWVEGLDMFTGRLDQAKQNMIALNEVMKDADKEAGAQIGNLEILYKTATDVTKSTEARIQAAKDLKATYPEAFANSSTMAILNGQESKSYQQLTKDIYAAAQAKAAQAKIEKLVSDQLDAKWEIDQNNMKKAADLAKVNGVVSSGSVGEGGTGSATGTVSEDLQKANIIMATNVANTKPTQNIKIMQGQIESLMSLAGGVSKAGDTLKKANELLGPNLENFNNLIKNASDKTDIDNVRRALQVRLDALAPSDPQIKDIEDKLRQVEAIEKKYAPKVTDGKTATSAGETLLAAQTSELQKIESLKEKYKSKDDTRDQQAQDAIKASFKQQTDAIAALNAEYDNYVAKYGAAAAKAAGLQRIDPSVLDSSETNALAGLAGMQTLEETKNQVAQQKAVFTEYEAFKLKSGTGAANTLYANELKGFDNYIDYLKSLQPTEAELNSSNAYTKARASAVADYLKAAIPAAQDDEFKQNAKHLQDLIIQDQDYQQKRATLVAKTNEDILTLNAKGFTRQAEQLQQATNDQLSQLDVQHFETQTIYANLFNNLDKQSQAYQDKQIDRAKAYILTLYQTGEITTEAYQKLLDAINKVKQANDDRSADDLIKAGQGLSEIGTAFQNINSGVASYISSLGQLLTSLGNVDKAMNQLKLDQQSGSDTTGDYISLFTSGLKAVSSIIGTITSAAAQRKQAAEDYYNSVIAFQNQYNVALDEQVRLQYKADANVFLTNYSEELKNAADAYNAAVKQYEQSLTALQDGRAKTGQKNVVNGSAVGTDAVGGAVIGAEIGGAWGAAIGAAAGAIVGLFTSKKKVDVFGPLLQQYPQLIEANGKFNESLAKTLIANNQVDDATKVLLQNTIAYYDEEQASIDQINSALSDLAQNLGSNLENALVTAFENGTDAAKAFGSTVSDVIGNIIQQFLFEDIFGSQFDALNKSLQATVLAGGGPADITNDFIDFFKTAGPLVKEFQDGLGAAQKAGAAEGLTLFPSTTTNTTTTPQTLTGQISASLTEDTGSMLVGSFNGMRLVQIMTNDILTTNGKTMQDQVTELRTQTLLQMQIAANTKATADNTSSISDSVKNIDKNTSSSSLTNLLRAMGHN